MIIRHQLLTFMSEYDKDLSGSIDGSEFSMIMVHEFDVTSRTFLVSETSIVGSRAVSFGS